jgi:hypothetical protein
MFQGLFIPGQTGKLQDVRIGMWKAISPSEEKSGGFPHDNRTES